MPSALGRVWFLVGEAQWEMALSKVYSACEISILLSVCQSVDENAFFGTFDGEQLLYEVVQESWLKLKLRQRVDPKCTLHSFGR